MATVPAKGGVLSTMKGLWDVYSFSKSTLL